MVGSPTASPRRGFPRILMDGEFSVSTSRRCEVLREVLFGVSCKGNDPIQWNLFGRDAEVVALASPADDVAPNRQQSRTYRRLALNTAYRVVGRRIRSRAMYAQGQSFAERNVISAKIIDARVERHRQRSGRSRQDGGRGQTSTPATVPSVNQCRDLAQLAFGKTQFQTDRGIAKLRCGLKTAFHP